MDKILITETDRSEAKAYLHSEKYYNQVFKSNLALRGVAKYFKSKEYNCNSENAVCKLIKVNEDLQIIDLLVEDRLVGVVIVDDDSKLKISKVAIQHGFEALTYVVVKVDEDFESVEIKGVVDFENVEKIEDNDFYEIAPENLTSIDNFKEVLLSKPVYELNKEDENNEKAEELLLGYVDDEIPEADRFFLLSQLVINDNLRETYKTFVNMGAVFRNIVSQEKLVSKVLVVTNVIEEENDFEIKYADSNHEDEEEQHSFENQDEIGEIETPEVLINFDDEPIFDINAQTQEESIISDDTESYNLGYDEGTQVAEESILEEEPVFEEEILNNADENIDSNLQDEQIFDNSDFDESIIDEDFGDAESLDYAELAQDDEEVNSYAEFSQDDEIPIISPDDMTQAAEESVASEEDMLSLFEEMVSSSNEQNADYQVSNNESEIVEYSDSNEELDVETTPSKRSPVNYESSFEEAQVDNNFDGAEAMNIAPENQEDDITNYQNILDYQDPIVQQQLKLKQKFRTVIVVLSIVLIVAGSGFLILKKNKKEDLALLENPSAQEQTMPSHRKAAENDDVDKQQEAKNIDDENSQKPSDLNNQGQPDELPVLPSNIMESVDNDEGNTVQSKPRDINDVLAKAVDKEHNAARISKISWEISESLAKNKEINKYLVYTGKAVKTSLGQELLFTNDKTITDTIKLSVEFQDNGTINYVNLDKTTGSSEIDKILLKTVKETLNYFKMPPVTTNVGKYTAYLVINL